MSGKKYVGKSSSILKIMTGTELPTLRSSHLPPAETPTEAMAQWHDHSTAEVEDHLAELRAADKLGDFMDHAPFVTNQATTQIWGVKAAPERDFNFTRWYFFAKDKALIDLFLTQELYDAAEVPARRALAHKFGTRYAALGPNHSRAPHKDAKLRKQYPSLVEQLSEKK